MDIKPGNIYQVSYSNLDTNSLLPFKISYWEYNKNDFLWSWHSFERNDIFTVVDVRYHYDTTGRCLADIEFIINSQIYVMVEEYVNVEKIFTDLVKKP